ncbi:MAG: hypothetical protein R6U36_09375 [Candidatus Fermentibacteraceae bacterium]
MIRRSLPLLLLLSSAALAVDVSYNNNYSQFKQQSRLDNSFSFTQTISRKLRFTATAGFNAQRNDDLEKFDDGRSGDASIGYTPIRGLELSTMLEQSTMKNQRYGETTRDEEAGSASGQIRYSPGSWVSMTMELGSYRHETWESDTGRRTVNEGALRNGSVSVTRRLFDLVSTNLSYSNSRSLGSERDNGTDRINARLNYDLPRAFRGATMAFSVGGNSNFVDWQDSSATDEAGDYSYSASLTLPALLPSLSLDLGTTWRNDYRLLDVEGHPDSQSVNDREGWDRAVSASLRWEASEELDLTANISRNIGRDDRLRQGPGTEQLYDIWNESERRRVRFVLTYTPGDARIEFQRNVDLYSWDTFGKWYSNLGTEFQDNSDKDDLTEVISLYSEVKLSEGLELRSTIQGQQSEMVFLKAEQSANSYTSSIYSFEPGYTAGLGSGWEIDHDVKLTADYTTYLFPAFSGDDILFRRLNSDFSLQTVGSDSTVLGISHHLRFQDQGNYIDGVFYRSEESLENRITLNTGFHLSRGVGVTPSYGWQYNYRDYPGGTIERTSEHQHHVGLRTNLRLQGGRLSLSLTRTFYTDEDRVSDWRANVSFNYLL